jgi:hypothetical protein
MRIIPILVAVCLVTVPTQAKYGGGSGTADDPYEIGTAADLIALGEDPNDYDKHFILTDDIDLDPNLLGGHVFDKAVIAPDTDPNDMFSQFQGASFTGVFDGNDHTISHLTITGADYLGLFGRLASGAEVKDLGVLDVDVTSWGGPVGGLVGYNFSGATVVRCYSTGRVSSPLDAGGLVGRNDGVVTQCSSTGAVSGAYDAGGVVGQNSGTVTQCYSTGMVSGTGDYVGGLVGYSGWQSVVTRCCSTGTVRGRDYVGGLVGRNDGDLLQCYSTGAVSGAGVHRGVGGLVGETGGAVSHCYSTGAVSCAGEYAGGLVGRNWWGKLIQSFWDTQTSGQAWSAGGTGKTTPEMQTGSTFLLWGTAGKDAIWTIDEGKDYPRLWWENAPGEPIAKTYCYGGGSGTQADPYVIYTAGELNVIGLIPFDWDKHFKLMADIDMSAFDGREGRPAFNLIAPGGQSKTVWGTSFTGVFDGNGHTISHLTIAGGGSHVGLFSRLESGAEVRDLGVVSVNITGVYYVAGLAGYNGGSVMRCYSTGAVSGGWSVGGLVAQNYGAITTSCSAGTVSGNGWSVGGLVCENHGTVTNCYSIAAVSSTSSGGGLVGTNYNRASVSRCYSAGAVSGVSSVGGLVGRSYYGTVSQCFWDIETSGQATSDGGAGKTTAQMQTAATFFGWGVCNEGVWAIDDGKDYPRLTWEHKPGQVIEVRLSDFLAGTGTEDDPYLIYTAEDINTIARFPCEQDKRFRLMFVEGQGTPESPYLIATAEQIALLNLCPYERDAHFRLAFVTGEGTQDSPYLIYTADELNLVGMCPYERDAHFKLMADIDLSAFDGNDGRPTFNMIADWGECWGPGLCPDEPFSGVFDGNDHAISNFSYTCTETYNIGLFGYVSGLNSVIENLKLTWPNIDGGEGGNVGALVGYLESGTVANCHVEGGSVFGEWEVGGLVGASYQGKITDCNSTATVSGNDSVGGLVGRNGWQSVVTQCSSTATVSGGSSVGGLVGSNQGTISYCDSAGRVLGDYSIGGLVGTSGCFEDWWWCEEPGTIFDSYSTAGVLGTGSNCGGLVGSNDAGEVARCYASGIVLGVSTVGGLAGWNGGNISSCYSTADVGGEKDVGGLVGLNSGGWLSPEAAIANCYSTGIVLGDEYVGGLVGDGDANDVVASMWDIETSGQGMSAGGTGKTTAEMQMASTFVNAGLPAAVGWDFVGETANGAEDIWAICEGVDYPRLAWEFVTGDFDADADTDFADFCILAEHWLSADGSFWCRRRSEAMATERGLGCDLTNDGSVNWQDLMVFAENWLR